MWSAWRRVEMRWADDQGGAALHEGVQVIEDGFLGVGVHRGERVVEDENLRPANERPGQGRALLLAAGQGDAAFADEGVETLGELVDVLFELSLFGHGVDLGLCGRVHAVGEVGIEGIGK